MVEQSMCWDTVHQIDPWNFIEQTRSLDMFLQIKSFNLFFQEGSFDMFLQAGPMNMFLKISPWLQQISNVQFPILFLTGLMIISSLFLSLLANRFKLPSIVAYMIMGIILGPSVTGLLGEKLLNDMGFLTKLILAFVALKIGMEIDLKALKRKGNAIITIALTELFGAVILVAVGIYLLTGDIALALFLGAIAPASAPAGLMAVIDEYKAKGSLTQALIAIVGIDDGLGIIIFGFVTPVATVFIAQTANPELNGEFLVSFLEPLREIVFSIILGLIAGKLFIWVGKDNKTLKYAMALTFGFVTLLAGICQAAHLSFILTNMLFGIVIGNDRKHQFMREIEEKDVGIMMPLFYLVFFTLAGANLHIQMLPELGFIGLTYIVCRSFGLYGGAFLGASAGKVEPKIRNYLGLGILSQAGVAIGLSLILKQQLHGVGSLVEGEPYTLGDQIGRTVFTTVTATSVFFELIGPITAKVGLKKAGEISED